ncbi:MAG: hypothetical protein KF699_02275 [Phycisphaeraceae bacterium]|nr:hypothetical protein [Phycisphaeraceae bacterium]MBX3407539.1 hypothetical protein [Phycisphaeraceae bacterium]
MSVIDETPQGQRQVKITVTWGNTPPENTELHLQYDVYRNAAQPPFVHLRPQEVIKFENNSKRWMVKLGDPGVVEDRDEAGFKTWTFSIPIEQTWDVPYPWNGHVTMRVSAYVKLSQAWRGATGTPSQAIVPQP